MKKTLIVFLISFLSWFTCLTGQTIKCIDAQNIRKGTLTNLYKISDNIYRSEQPATGDWEYLSSEGIVTVINFRYGDTDQNAPDKTSIRFVHLPMKAQNIKYEKVVECLKLIKNSGGPVLVHCLHGSDRTGCIIACCRMVFCGWTREQAINEFLDERFGYHRFWFPGIEKFIKKVDIEKLRKDVFAE